MHSYLSGFKTIFVVQVLYILTVTVRMVIERCKNIFSLLSGWGYFLLNHNVLWSELLCLDSDEFVAVFSHCTAMTTEWRFSFQRLFCIEHCEEWHLEKSQLIKKGKPGGILAVPLGPGTEILAELAISIYLETITLEGHFIDFSSFSYQNFLCPLQMASCTVVCLAIQH